jgi:3-isopropylmalate dehydrogenase
MNDPSTLRVAVIPGDGTGPEVTREARKTIVAAGGRFGFSAEFVDYDLGGDRYLATGETLPESVLRELARVDAIFLGAIGHPDVRPGVLERGILLRIRRELDEYVNLRPIKLYEGVATPLTDKGPADIDMVVVRENTEGLYAGAGGFVHRGTPQETATQESINTRFAVERCIRFAFEVARTRERRRLTFCGKTNVLTYAHDLWDRTFAEVATDYPEVSTDYAHVDAVCMWMVKSPEWFDVIVTDNMFGDIITDLGAMIQGGMGLAAGGNLNPEGVSMFEPIGGSAPKYTGQGIINPLAAIAAAGMLLEHSGQVAAGRAIEAAVAATAGALPSLAAGQMGLTTAEVGDRVAGIVAEA